MREGGIGNVASIVDVDRSLENSGAVDLKQACIYSSNLEMGSPFDLSKGGGQRTF